MTRRLDSNWFTLQEIQTAGADCFQTYSVDFPTIVLFSKVDPLVPLAAVSFVPRNNMGNARTVIAPCKPPASLAADGVEMCRGLSRVDNDEIAFVIHNLTDFVKHPSVNVATSGRDYASMGMMKVDIMTSKTKVDWVNNSVFGINQCNELAPSDSYVVESNSQDNDRTIVLRGAVDSDQKAVSVGTEEKAGTLRGTYYWINVVAAKGFPQLTALFKDTTWRCVDFFTRRLPTNHCNPSRAQPSFMFGSTHIGQFQSASGGCGGVMAFGRPNVQRSNSGILPLSLQDSGRQAASIASFSVRQQPYFGVPKGRGPAQISAQPTALEMSQAQVGTLVSGDQTVDVRSVETAVDYEYDHAGKMLCMGLAVWRDLRVMSGALSYDEARLLAKTMTSEAAAGKNEDLLKKLNSIFVTEDCVVCSDAKSSIVFYNCGHQCACVTCAKKLETTAKCCMCRAAITAMIPTSV